MLGVGTISRCGAVCFTPLTSIFEDLPMSNNNDNSNNIYFIVEEPITEEVTTTIESERGGERDGRRDTGGGWGATEPRRSRFDAIQQIREQTVKRLARQRKIRQAQKPDARTRRDCE